jgi:hypothetical protein
VAPYGDYRDTEKVKLNFDISIKAPISRALFSLPHGIGRYGTLCIFIYLMISIKIDKNISNIITRIYATLLPEKIEGFDGFVGVSMCARFELVFKI